MKEKPTSKVDNYYILLITLSVTLLLLEIVLISYYCKKHQSKQKHILPFYQKYKNGK